VFGAQSFKRGSVSMVRHIDAKMQRFESLDYDQYEDSLHERDRMSMSAAKATWLGALTKRQRCCACFCFGLLQLTRTLLVFF
jgi:hypothetical protein